MITSNEAAKSAIRDGYVPESTVDALLDEMAALHRQIKLLTRDNFKKQVVIDYLEKRR